VDVAVVPAQRRDIVTGCDVRDDLDAVALLGDGVPYVGGLVQRHGNHVPGAPVQERRVWRNNITMKN